MRHWYGLLTALMIGGCAATAQPGPAAAAGADEPPLIAGRLAAVEGEVRIWRAEEDGGGQWDIAQLNDVVTVGTGIAVDNGRAEVRVGPHAFRLGVGSVGGFEALDFQAKHFTLERGVLNVRLAPAQQGESIALQVAAVRIDLAAPGHYRIDAVDGAPLGVTVFEGQAQARHGTSNVSVFPGQTLSMTQSSVRFSAAGATALDEWAAARDLRYQQLAAARYVSPYMTGYEELDAHGDWIGDATYGTVWVPRAVPVGWAPYRDGRWRWVAPWGWTWVDAAPWGYAPFHYGRWVVIGGRWCWWPGRVVARPVWAPALVGFVGGGPAIGWYPLAPWHPYRPHYRSNPTYVTVINQTIIARPPHGTPPDLNQRPGSTWVPAPRFREPVVKVRIPAQTEKVADPPAVVPTAPPPRPQRTAPTGDSGPSSAVPARVMPPQVRAGQRVAQSTPKFGVSPQPALPGDATLSQPAPIRRVEPRPLPPVPGQIPDRTQGSAPRPKPNLPQEIVPPYQQLQRPFPAEPARTPPAAPPTVRQPAASPVVAPTAPPVRAKPPRDNARAAPAPQTESQPAPDARGNPAGNGPRPKVVTQER
jgi:hypothetical protein